MNRKRITIIALISVIILVTLIDFIISRDITSNNNEISFVDMNEKLQLCIASHIPINKQEFVINSQEEYDPLLGFRSPADFCDNFELPTIDFSQNTLLGKYTEGVGCSINFVRHIFKNDLNKKIIYTIEVVEEGMCAKFGMSWNWALIPKVPSDYNVEFQMNNRDINVAVS